MSAYSRVGCCYEVSSAACGMVEHRLVSAWSRPRGGTQLRAHKLPFGRCSLDHLVGTRAECERQRDTKGRHTLQIDCQIKARRLYDGQLGRLGTFGNLVDNVRDIAKKPRQIDTVTHRHSRLDDLAESTNRGNMPLKQVAHNRCAIAQEYRTRRNHHRFARHISHLSKGRRIIRRLTSHLNATRFETERFACRCRGLIAG